MNNFQLEQLLNSELKPQLIKDYCPNGLQVEGSNEIKKDRNRSYCISSFN